MARFAPGYPAVIRSTAKDVNMSIVPLRGVSVTVHGIVRDNSVGESSGTVGAAQVASLWISSPDDRPPRS